MKQIQDFFAWLSEVMDGIGTAAAPAKALGLREGAPAILRREGDGYVADRPAKAGDAAPLLLGEDDALAIRFSVPGEAALHGRAAARIEAARRCPFPLDAAAWSLARASEAWGEGAPWRLAAAPKAKLDALRETVAATGAAPGPPFVMSDGASTFLSPGGAAKRAPLVPVAVVVALLAAVGAAIAVEIGSTRMTEAANARLADARAALNAAEARASEADAAREAAAAPIRAAIAGDALFAAAPSAGAALAALTEATPDTAHMRRLTIRPDALEGEFIAPDAAALARALADAPHFDAAVVAGAARTDAATGLQRAVIRIELEDARP